MMRLFPEKLETIAGASRALRRGDVTSAALVQNCLERIDELEPKVRAWVALDRDGARLRASQLDAELHAGRWRGPLHGIPIGIKDIIDVAGFPTGAGSEQMARVVAASDAPVVQKLRAAGAVLLGKTVTTQFACFDPPPTRNPWNLERTPGGSSSGSCAAVAAGMCLGAIGSQTGGSITRPAAFCGVAGCKPSFGRVSLSGIVALAPSLDHPGPIARCVRDLAILLDAISGRDPLDPRTQTATIVPIDPLEVDTATVRPPRCVRLRGFFESEADPAMRVAMDQAVDAIRGHGAVITEAELPPTFADVHLQHRTVFLYELATGQGRRFREMRDDYLPGVASLIEEGLAVPPDAYQAAKAHQSRAWSEADALFGSADIALSPSAIGAAPDTSTTGNPIFNAPWSHTGLPTVSIPVGLTADGLPLAIQIIGRRFDEPRLFRSALWCEALLRDAHVASRLDAL